MIAYFNGRFLPKEEITLSPDDRAFLFGDGVYEVVRAYGGKLFQLPAHLERLRRSLREVQLSEAIATEMGQVAPQLLAQNGLTNGDATVYIEVTRGAAPRKHAFPGADTAPTVYAAASPFTPVAEKYIKGVKIILVPDIRWARCDIKAVSLLPNVLANQQAHASGAEEAVFVRDGAITEGTHTNFAAVFGGQLVTAPLTHYILDGITRQVVLGLCRNLGIPVREYPILAEDFPETEEMMILGTTTEVMPVVQVNDAPVGRGAPGPVTLKLYQALRDLTR